MILTVNNDYSLKQH